MESGPLSTKSVRADTRSNPPPVLAKRQFPWLLLGVALFCTWFVWDSLTPRLPEPNAPPILYSNQCNQDIRATLLSALKEASSSIHLVMFGLTDRAILSTLAKKIHDEIKTTVYYDLGGSPKIFRHLQGGDIHPVKHVGLMHQKILVLDEERVFIGSANMTHASLKMHDNLVIGMMSRPIARFLMEHKPYDPGYLKSTVGGQEVELWLLPDPRGHALAELRKQIRSAKKTLQIALFTFTHPQLLEEVIAAHERGVKVSVVIDMHSGMGASIKTVEKLKKSDVPVKLSMGVQLLHHKFVYIDEQTLFTGSANWTKAAFYKNCDCILALHRLTDEQKEFMKNLWRKIDTTSKEDG